MLYLEHFNHFNLLTGGRDIHAFFNLLSPESGFQASGSKMTFPEQMTISSLLKGVNEYSFLSKQGYICELDVEVSESI